MKRPFDDAVNERITAESRAVLDIVSRVEAGLDVLIWSTALTLENEADPDAEPRLEVAKFAARSATETSVLSSGTASRARQLAAAGIAALDALHLAFAESCGCDVLITCNDRFIRRSRAAGTFIGVLNPIEYMSKERHDPTTDR